MRSRRGIVCDMDPVELTRIPVDSSSIATIGYSPSTNTMEVVFRRGAVYRYLRVPDAVFAEFLSAPSKGRYFNGHVKNHYTHQRG